MAKKLKKKPFKPSIPPAFKPGPPLNEEVQMQVRDQCHEPHLAELLSSPRVRKIYVNYPNDSPLIIRAMTDDCHDDRSVEFNFTLYLMPGESQIDGLRRVCNDIMDRVR